MLYSLFTAHNSLGVKSLPMFFPEILLCNWANQVNIRKLSIPDNGIEKPTPFF